jgi:hypothetical protein
MSLTQLLDAVLPYPKKCCGQRQIALKRMQFANWINRHRNLNDAEIIENLKKML